MNTCNGVKASIDIGTNSTRLLAAKIIGGQTKDLHREARVTRLGQGVDKNKFLSREAIKRTIDVLLDYKEIARNVGATEIIIAATSAARDAQNIEDFIEEVKQNTGLKLKVLSAEQEAELSFQGAISSFFPSPLTSHLSPLVLDIGGGSTELILETEIATRPSGARNDVIARSEATKQSPISLAFSKDIGSVRLTEMFIKNDPPLEKELQKAADYIEQVYTRPVEEILNKTPEFQMLGTAGTITNLAALNLGLEIYVPEKVHGSTLSLEAVEEQFQKLKKLTVAEREQIKIIQPGRADVIVTGTLILLTLMKMLNAPSLIVSEKDILDGLLLNF